MRRHRCIGLGIGVAALVFGGAIWQRSHPAGERRVFGFVVGWDAASLTSLEAHAGDLTDVVAEGFALGEQPNTLQDNVAPAVVATARRHGLPVFAMMSNYDGGWQPARVRRLWATPGARAAFAAALTREVERRGFQGVNLDFENLADSDRAGLTALCACLASTLQRRQLLLAIDVPVGRSTSATGAYDLAALSHSCDFIVAMAYDEHGATSHPGPVASRDWALRALASVRSSVPPRKLVAGLGAYGYDWGPSGSAAVTGFSRALTTARSRGATVRWDAAARAPCFRYDIDGAPHQVWFEDAASVSSRIAAARRGGFAGVSVWRLGAEDPALWTELQAYRRGRELRNSMDTPLSLADVVHLEGEGDFLTVNPGTRGGLRRFRRRGGEVEEERYPELPAAFLVHRAGAPQQREMALTFDDGPDPEYTPRVLDVLRRERVPATFFVVGSRAEAYPDLIRRIYAEGHVLGNHTYSHINISQASSLRGRLELNATQRVIEAITGHHTAFFRPPYDTDSRPETRAELTPILRASEEGYVTVAAAIDPADWARPSPDQIVARCLQEGSDGGIIVLHDAGGDRSTTVRALPRLIRAYRARGCRFVALHDLIGRSRDAVMPAVAQDPWGSRLLALTVLSLSPVTHLFALVVLLGLVLFLLRALIVPSLAWWHYRFICDGSGAPSARLPAPGFRLPARRDRDRTVSRLASLPARSRESGAGSRLSVLVPAFNEERVIGKTLEHLLASDYPDMEILVIDDGSADGTEAAVAPFLADPRVRYLRQENSGKGAALNEGIRRSHGEIVVALDADTLFEPTTISRLVRRFAEPRVGAVAGNIKVGNRGSLLTQWQSLEYVVGTNLDKRFFDVLNCVTVVPGSVGAWRRAALEQVGGFSSATLAEDTDLTFAVRRAGYRILFEPRAVAWTEAPTTVSCLAKQRLRWVFGTFQCLWKHRRAFLNPRAGTLGLVAMPYVLLFHVLMTLFGPLIDASVLGMCLLGQGKQMALLALPFLVMEGLLAAAAFAFEREPKWPLLLVPLQRLVYRQLIYGVMLQSALCVLKGRHPGWQKSARVGTATVVTTSALGVWLLLAPLAVHAASPQPAPTSSASPGTAQEPTSGNPSSGSQAPLAGSGPTSGRPADPRPAAHLPAALFDFEEFWDLVDGRGIEVGLQAGTYPQPVSDAQGRGAAMRSGVSAVTAVSLDRVTTLALERFQGETYRPGLEGDMPLRSTWTGVKLTRRIAPGTTVSVLQLTGDAMATGFSAGHGRAWGLWEADVGLWVSSDTARMGLESSYAGFDASLSRDIGHGLRVGADLAGSLVRGQLAALTLQYAAPEGRTNATVALRQWYGAVTLLELRGWRRLGRGWQLGVVATTQPTFSLSVKQRL